jgi:hypothetical protein
MDAKKRQMTVYIFAVLAIIWALSNILGDSIKKEKTKERLQSPVENTAVTEKPVRAIDIDRYQKLGWGRDPFYRRKETREKHIEESKTIVGWELGGILWNEKNPSAVINKQIVRHGDIVDGARVVKIGKNLVTLEKDNIEFILNIKKDKS